MVSTHLIENWTGDKKISGPDLSMRMFEHSTAFGATYKYGDVTNLSSKGEFDHQVTLASGEVLEAKAVIIATGMVERKPMQVENIMKFENRGVSYCAICDGPIYKGKPVAVMGGGNSAIEEAQFLAQFASEVKVFVRHKVVAEKRIIREFLEKGNTKIIEDTNVKGVYGESGVEKLISINPDGSEEEHEIYALFPYIGQDPVTNFAKDLNITNEWGFIKTNEHMETSTPGIYAIGDVREKEIRQIATAVADGAIVGKILSNKL